MYDMPSLMKANRLLEITCDVPMHNLFLGVAKTLYLDIQEWLRITNKAKTFHRMVSGVLDEVHALDLSWCRCPPFSTNKSVGWVSENFIGYERCCLWVMSLILNIPDKESYQDLVSEPSTWRKAIYVSWLSHRGLESKGKLLEVKTRVLDYYKNNNIPPILPSKGASTDTVMKLLFAKKKVLSIAMNNVYDNNKAIMFDCCVRHFLSLYKQFDDENKQST
jgi:hypothetical protein